MTPWAVMTKRKSKRRNKRCVHARDLKERCCLSILALAVLSLLTTLLDDTMSSESKITSAFAVFVLNLLSSRNRQGPNGTLSCKLCREEVQGEVGWNAHCATKKHMKVIQRDGILIV